MIINEDIIYPDLSDEELQEGIVGITEVFDQLSSYKHELENTNYNISKYEAEEIGDKIFDIIDVPYLSDYMDEFLVVLSKLDGYNSTTSKEVYKILDKLLLKISQILRELEDEKKFRF